MMRSLFLLIIIALCAVNAACSSGSPAPAADSAAGAVETLAQSPTPEPPRPPTVVIDPGHGGDEVGAANHGVVEKHSNLDMALRVERILVEAGVRVVLTRREDTRVGVRTGAQSGSGTGTGFPATRFDLQARIDMANAEKADFFLSIHSNGSTDPTQSGVEMWYDPNREFGAQNHALAQSMQASVLRELAAYGYRAADRGIKDDTCFRFRNGRCFPLFLLGPARTTTREDLIRRGVDPEALGFEPGQAAVSTRPTNMPGVLAEVLFISNARDAAVLRDDAGRDAIARGIASALLEALGLRPLV